MRHFIVIMSIFTQISCGTSGVVDKPQQRVTSQQTEQLTALAASIKEWAPTCGDGWICEEGSDGDTLLWAGLSGQCDTVFDSQGPDGRVYRNPGRIGIKQTNSFSRDQLLGYFRCLIQERNVESAEAFLAYIVSKDYLLCDDATDNRCDIGYVKYRVMWGLMLRIWKYLGLEPTWEMEQSDIGDDTSLITTAKTVEIGYALHLVSIQIYLRRLLDSETPKTNTALNTVVNRQPGNPWYAWLRYGSTSKVAQSVLEKCPKDPPARKSQWSWQRSTDERAWENSMGHECIFLINRILGGP